MVIAGVRLPGMNRDMTITHAPRRSIWCLASSSRRGWRTRLNHRLCRSGVPYRRQMPNHRRSLATTPRYAERAGRDPAEIDTIYRLPLSGNAEQVATDIRRYEQMGVSHLIVGFGTTGDLAETLENMEEFATRVWPLV